MVQYTKSNVATEVRQLSREKKEIGKNSLIERKKHLPTHCHYNTTNDNA